MIAERTVDGGRADQARIDAFTRDLLAAPIATEVLERWSGGAVHAQIVSASDAPADAARSVRLRIGANDRVIHRRARLMRGGVVLSETENWYVPSRLSPETCAALERTDTPFGTLIRDLDPVRTLLSAEPAGEGAVLRIHALVSRGDGVPVAEVVERYLAGVVAG